MASDDKITVRGVVTNVYPGSKFEVTLENGSKVQCTMSGKLRVNQIRIINGDNVDIELSAYDLTRGRIIWRYK